MSVVPRPSSDALRAAVAKKVIVITGAAQGMGLGFAKLFAKHNANVVMVDVNGEVLQASASQIGTNCSTFVCDVTSWEQQVKLFESVKEKHGHIDVLCCNAGVNPEILTGGADDDPECQDARTKVAYDWMRDESDEQGILKKPATKLFEINLIGVIYGIKLGLHHMKDRPGNIIITGSAASYLGIGGQDLYTASKHALLGLMRSTITRPDFQKQTVALSMVGPWYTKTPMTAKFAKHRTQNTPASVPEDVAWAVGYLLTIPREQANGKCLWIQGQELMEVEESYQQWLLPKIKASGFEWKE